MPMKSRLLLTRKASLRSCSSFSRRCVMSLMNPCHCKLPSWPISGVQRARIQTGPFAGWR